MVVSRRMRAQLRTLASLLVPITMVAACASEVIVLPSGAGSGGSGAAGGSGPTTVGTGATGGTSTTTVAAGGSGATTTVGTGGGLPCGVDCSQIVTPPCQHPICDEAQGSCVVLNDADGSACDDGVFCTINDSCSAGICLGGGSNTCGLTPAACEQVFCNEMAQACNLAPGNDGLPCSTSNMCLTNTVCAMGQCVGTPTDCSAYDQDCVMGVCDPTNGLCNAQPANEGGMCDDSNSCTTGTTCMIGTCGGGMNSATVFFSEDFADNSAGWTLGNEWQIGPAMASQSSPACGNGDPGQDYTPTADNGVAGVVIGGDAAQMPHPVALLTSPPIDTSVAPGPLFLQFRRWLNSDYTPFMQNSIEVFNGTSWVMVWQSGNAPGIQDASWTLQSYDITAHKAPNMQVRFGFTTSNGVFSCSSWNIDDIAIADMVCN